MYLSEKAVWHTHTKKSPGALPRLKRDSFLDPPPPKKNINSEYRDIGDQTAKGVRS